MINLSIFIFIAFIKSPFTFANENSSGTVIKVTGEVLASIKGKEIKIRQGDKIPAMTFIESKEKSFAIILFEDQTKLTLGPKSKIQVINPSSNEEPGIIDLLQGQIRNKIIKPGEMNKYFVNSKAAAIGVRGTEFIAIYNPLTNSLTSGGFSGVVAIGPSIEGPLNIQSAKNALNDGAKNVYFLKAKHFTSVQKTNNGLKISAPQKLSPLQYVQLKKNETPTLKSNSIFKETSEKKRTTSLPNVSINFQSGSFIFTPEINPATEPTISLENANQLPAGSFIDLNSGAIIPPPPGSEYDPNSKTFIIDGTMGTVSEDGNYVAPEGLKINDEGKFVASNPEEAKRLENNKYIATLNNLVENAKNSEAIMFSPSSQDINNLNNKLGDDQNQGDNSNVAKDNTETNQNPTFQMETIADNNESTSQFTEVNNSYDSNCPGNICDKFDTVAPTSDEASQKTLVQFIIRINNN